MLKPGDLEQRRLVLLPGFVDCIVSPLASGFPQFVDCLHGMNKVERELFANIIDCLDRLYDGVNTAGDVRSLLFATAAALSGSPIKEHIDACLPLVVARMRETPDQRRESVLAATDDLRVYVAEALSRDAKDNPKQRHNTRPG
jgi:hypothetical protein